MRAPTWRCSDNGEDFAQFVWTMAGGSVIVGDGHLHAKTPLSEAMSHALKARGFKFVGPVIVHAWLQAVGVVDDHALDCYRRKAVTKRPGRHIARAD